MFVRKKSLADESAAKAMPEPRTTEPKTTATEPKPVSTSGSATGPGGLPLRSYEFDAVTVNSTGTITNRRKAQGHFYSEEVNGVEVEMVPIPAGTFTMGLSEDDSEGPQHRPTLKGGTPTVSAKMMTPKSRRIR